MTKWSFSGWVTVLAVVAVLSLAGASCGGPDVSVRAGPEKEAPTTLFNADIAVSSVFDPDSPPRTVAPLDYVTWPEQQIDHNVVRRGDDTSLSDIRVSDDGNSVDAVYSGSVPACSQIESVSVDRSDPSVWYLRVYIGAESADKMCPLPGGLFGIRIELSEPVPKGVVVHAANPSSRCCPSGPELGAEA